MSEEKYGARINLRLTGYWPYQSGLSPAERLMEGGTNDRKGRPLITLEMWRSDPEMFPYVSASGDFTAFPDGQLIEIPIDGQVVPCRVVDTGCHFFDNPSYTRCGPNGAVKVYRAEGYEPLDICVDSSATQLPTLVTGEIIEGSNFTGEQVDTSKLRGQVVSFGLLTVAGGMGGCGGTEGIAIFVALAALWSFLRVFFMERA